MTPDPARIRSIYKKSAAKNSAPIIYRRITRLNDVTPAENPPSTSSLLVNGATSSGATTISLKAATLTGYLRTGDKFTLGGVVYTVAADTAAAVANAIAVVTFSPALAANAANNAPASMTFVGQTSLRGTVSAYPIRLIDGTLIQSRDLRIIIAAADLPVDPQTEDDVTFAGEVRKVVNATPRYVKDVVAGWDIQVR